MAKIQGGPLDNEDGGTTGQIELMVPGGKVGLIIGKSGETIKQLQVCEYWSVHFHIKLHITVCSSCCSCVFATFNSHLFWVKLVSYFPLGSSSSICSGREPLEISGTGFLWAGCFS